jgi:hypothetical protein
MAKPEVFLSGPIPGQSLTDTPKNYKWERPPQMADHEEVVKFYINKLADQDVMDDLAVLFDGGMPIAPFVESLTTTGVSEGLHTIDVSLIVGPVLHAFIKASMLQYGIDAKDDTYDPKKDPTEREKKRLMTAIELALADAQAEDRTAATDKGVAVLQEVQETITGQPTPQEADVDVPEADQEEMPAEAPRKGLMARGAM